MRKAHDYTLADACPALTALTGRAFVVAYDARPMPVNEYRKLHWAARTDYDAIWRNTFKLLGRPIPHLERCAIFADQFVAKLPLPDVGASALTLKACIDGLNDAGVFDDDTPNHVAFTGINPPELQRGNPDRFVLTVLELTP